jgi:hypothetical protein
MEGVTNEKNKIKIIAKLNLFTLGTITLSELKILNVVIFSAEVNMEDFMFNFPQVKG